MSVRLARADLERATDAREMTPLIARVLERIVPGGRLERVVVPRAFPERDASWVIQYVADVRRPSGDVASLYLCARLFPPDTDGRPGRNESSEHIGHETLPLVMQVFPSDSELPGLAAVWDGRASDPGMGRPSAEWRVLGYRAGRRCTLLARRPDGEWIVKVVRPRRANALAERLDALRRAGLDGRHGVTTPRPISLDSTLGAVTMSRERGVSLHERITRDVTKEDMVQTARALAVLHASEVGDDIGAFGVTEEIAVLERFARSLNDTLVALRPRVDAAIATLAHNAPEAPPTATVHRDFHDGQVLLAGSSITLVDCDGVTRGAPEIDAGNFLAHLILRGMQVPQARSRLAEAAETFEHAMGLDAERVDWWITTTLVRLVAVYAVRPRWRHLAEHLLEHAETRLGRRVA